jgi:hypothetical protein
MPGNSIRLLLAGACVLAIVLPASVLPAFAHDSWISRGKFRSPDTGELCCGDYDCFAIPASKVTLGPSGYELSHLGETIPYDKVLPSRDGQYWRCHRPNGTQRCFFVPNEGS